MDDGESQQHTERKLGLIHETEGDLNEKDVNLQSVEKTMTGSSRGDGKSGQYMQLNRASQLSKPDDINGKSEEQLEESKTPHNDSIVSSLYCERPV
jgi:hypothetical protein